MVIKLLSSAFIKKINPSFQTCNFKIKHQSQKNSVSCKTKEPSSSQSPDSDKLSRVRSLLLPVNVSGMLNWSNRIKTHLFTLGYKYNLKTKVSQAPHGHSRSSCTDPGRKLTLWIILNWEWSSRRVTDGAFGSSDKVPGSLDGAAEHHAEDHPEDLQGDGAAAEFK